MLQPGGVNAVESDRAYGYWHIYNKFYIFIVFKQKSALYYKVTIGWSIPVHCKIF